MKDERGKNLSKNPMVLKIPKKVVLSAATLFGACFVLLVVISVQQINDMSREIRTRFDGQKWSLPAVVYSRPLELYPGLELTGDLFEMELQLGGYRKDNPVRVSGGYLRDGERFDLMTRGFMFPSGYQPARKATINFLNGKVEQIIDEAGDALPHMRLDPARIGSFHPLVHEDRIVVQHSQIPPLFIETLMAVEDKQFFDHHGISLTGITRAFYVNLRAGRTVQGGSTLTQQLIKNFFLERERSLSRKVQEAIMALLLEYHYSKEEIITAYVNEVFMGQDGKRAIHGFGLASQFYFRRALEDLSVAQMATLVGMVKGPSFYDPLRRPENCIRRRDGVLSILLADGIIDEQIYREGVAQELSDVAPQKNGMKRFPGFVDLVRRQLKDEYREEDLKKNGLHILTTLDPQVQVRAEAQLKNTIATLENGKQENLLEGAVVITGRENGEVHALVGGKESRLSGFNRALDARRPIGSLVKPAVYLTALERGYTLASPLLDSAISLDNDGSVWRPRNYDRQEHGTVALYQALAHSYNLATVRLGMEIGVDAVAETLQKMGGGVPETVYPSLLLGAINMSPLEVAQVYQTIGSGGFYLPLRAIQAVQGKDGALLTRYGLKVEQRFSPEFIYLLHHGLTRVMEEGTARSYGFPDTMEVAGKTGTTNDFRDSWFAGYAGDRLMVVWLGNDGNQSVALTGASGALRVWGNIMLGMRNRSGTIVEPQGITWRRIDPRTLRSGTIFNPHATVLPFLAEGHGEERSGRSIFDVREVEQSVKDMVDSFRNIFQ